MVASATNATIEFNNINQNLISVDHKNPKSMLEAINNRIRFSSNLKRISINAEEMPAIQNTNLSETCETSLATIIADVEAATKI